MLRYSTICKCPSSSSVSKLLGLSSSAIDLRPTTSSRTLTDIVSRLSTITQHREDQRMKNIQQRVKNIINGAAEKNRITLPTTNRGKDHQNDYDEMMNQTILSSAFRLRKDVFQHKRERKLVEYDEARCEVIPFEYDTVTVVSPPTQAIDAMSQRFQKVVSTPSGEYQLQSVLMYCLCGTQDDLIAERDRRLIQVKRAEQEQQEGNEDDDAVLEIEERIDEIEFALTYPHVFTGWKKTQKNNKNKNRKNATIFVSDMESDHLEPSFLAAIKDSVEFASTKMIENDGKYYDSVTVVVNAPRILLIDLVQSKEFEKSQPQQRNSTSNKNNMWIFSDRVTLILVPSETYYSVSYMMKELQLKQYQKTNNMDIDFCHILMHPQMTKAKDGMTNAFASAASLNSNSDNDNSKNKNNVFYYNRWIGRNSMAYLTNSFLQMTTSDQQNNKSTSLSPSSSSSDPGTAGAKGDESNNYSNNKLLAQAFRKRVVEEGYTDNVIKIMRTSRKLMVAELEGYFLK